MKLEVLRVSRRLETSEDNCLLDMTYAHGVESSRDTECANDNDFKMQSRESNCEVNASVWEVQRGALDYFKA